jgi:hypothetical protein
VVLGQRGARVVLPKPKSISNLTHTFQLGFGLHSRKAKKSI